MIMSDKRLVREEEGELVENVIRERGKRWGGGVGERGRERARGEKTED